MIKKLSFHHTSSFNIINKLKFCFYFCVADCGKGLRDFQVVCTACSKAKICSKCKRELRLCKFDHTPGTDICESCFRRQEKQWGGSSVRKEKSVFGSTIAVDTVLPVTNQATNDPLTYLKGITPNLMSSLEERLSEKKLVIFIIIYTIDFYFSKH